jgi:hypothetical protein
LETPCQTSLTLKKRIGVELNVPRCLGSEIDMDITCNWRKW